MLSIQISAKPWDKVDYNILNKLNNVSVDGSLLKWVESYLTIILFNVFINGVWSETITVTSNVPQGHHCFGNSNYFTFGRRSKNI